MSQIKDEVYAAERALLTRRFPSLNIAWESRKLIEQIVSPLLSKGEAEVHYQKMYDVFIKKAGLKTHALVQMVDVDQRRHLVRIVISVKLLRELFGDELGSGDGGGGGKKFKVNPSPIGRMGRF